MYTCTSHKSIGQYTGHVLLLSIRLTSTRTAALPPHRQNGQAWTNIVFVQMHMQMQMPFLMLVSYQPCPPVSPHPRPGNSDRGCLLAVQGCYGNAFSGSLQSSWAAAAFHSTPTLEKQQQLSMGTGGQAGSHTGAPRLHSRRFVRRPTSVHLVIGLQGCYGNAFSGSFQSSSEHPGLTPTSLALLQDSTAAEAQVQIQTMIWRVFWAAWV
jgi:hypothetical protein